MKVYFYFVCLKDVEYIINVIITYCKRDQQNYVSLLIGKGRNIPQSFKVIV